MYWHSRETFLRKRKIFLSISKEKSIWLTKGNNVPGGWESGNYSRALLRKKIPSYNKTLRLNISQNNMTTKFQFSFTVKDSVRNLITINEKPILDDDRPLLSEEHPRSWGGFMRRTALLYVKSFWFMRNFRRTDGLMFYEGRPHSTCEDRVPPRPGNTKILTL